MSQYTAIAQRSLATIRRKGAAITWTLVSPGALITSTGRHAGATTSTVAGFVVQDEDDEESYRDLGLVAGERMTLLFAPTTAGEKPPLGASGTFGGLAYKVRAVRPISPDGTAIVSRVVVSR